MVGAAFSLGDLIPAAVVSFLGVIMAAFCSDEAGAEVLAADLRQHENGHLMDRLDIFCALSSVLFFTLLEVVKMGKNQTLQFFLATTR